MNDKKKNTLSFYGHKRETDAGRLPLRPRFLASRVPPKSGANEITAPLSRPTTTPFHRPRRVPKFVVFGR